MFAVSGGAEAPWKPIVLNGVGGNVMSSKSTKNLQCHCSMVKRDTHGTQS